MSLADSTDFSKGTTIAVSVESKTDGQTMVVATSGLLEGFDTSSFNEGDVLYLGTNGDLTNTQPAGINAVQRVGHAVKINASTGSILIELDPLTVIIDYDGTGRHQVVNTNTGIASAASYTLVNDAGRRASFSIFGGNTFQPNAVTYYNEGYESTFNTVDGNKDHVWLTDVTDAHNFLSTIKMTLKANGELETQQQIITHTALSDDDHALEIDCDADGHGDVKAVDIDYITGNIGEGSDEAVILVNIDESAATGGDVTALEVLATEGNAQVNGMLTGVGVNPIGQLSGAFGDMDSALSNAVDVLADFISAGSNVQIFSNDNDTVTIGNAVKFEEIEFLLAVFSSQNINPTFEFSTGVGTWTTFSPVDGTNGLLNNGVIAWLDSDIPTWALGTGSEYLIKITRTRNGLATPPTESLVQIAEAVLFSWDKDGAIKASSFEGDASLLTNLPTKETVTFSWDDIAEGGNVGFLSIVSVGSFTAINAAGKQLPPTATIKEVRVNLTGSSSAAAAGNVIVQLQRREAGNALAYTAGSGTSLQTANYTIGGSLGSLVDRAERTTGLSQVIGGTNPILYAYVSGIGFASLTSLIVDIIIEY